jgi:hypothetical protein
MGSALKKAVGDDEMLIISDYDHDDNGGPKLGIDIGHNLNPMNETEKKLLRKDVEIIIDEEIEKGILDLERLRDWWRREMDKRNDSLEQAMTLNGIRESEMFDIKIDDLVGKFMNKTSASRERTHYLARIAEEEAKEEERENKKKSSPKEIPSWGKTNNAWDDWDDWNYGN